MTLFLAPASAAACQYDDMAGGRFSPFHMRMAQQSTGDRFVDAILAEGGEAPFDWRKPDEAQKPRSAASPQVPASDAAVQELPAA